MSKLVAGIALAVVALIFVGYGMFSLGSLKVDSSFKAKIDSLNKVNDSLVIENKKDDSTITVLEILDKKLETQVAYQKTHVKVIHDRVDKQVEVIKRHDSAAIVKFYTSRYPLEAKIIDTLIPINKPVLISAASDLTRYDGARQEIIVKDSIISTQENRITLKDSTITLFKNKEMRYGAIIWNKNQVISEWKSEYNVLSLNYKKLQVKNKFQKIGTAIIAGGLIYTLIHK
jgi:hypothetical protein